MTRATGAPSIGHNSEAMSPFDVVTGEIGDLYEEATNWCDGEEISSQEMADAVAKLMDAVRAAHRRAEALRRDEKRPIDEAGKAVQARFRPHIEKAERAIDACKAALTPWLQRQEEQRRAAAEKARQEAEEQRRAAVDAIQASKGDLAAREVAECQLAAAKASDAEATRFEKAKTQAKGGARAASLRKRLVAVVTDEREFARHVWEHHRDELSAWLADVAQKRVNAGERKIPGVSIREEETVV